MSANSRGIEAFLEMMAAERGAAANTLDAYRRDLSDYQAALGRAGKTPFTAETDDITAYLRSLKGRGFSPHRRARGGCRRSGSFIVFSMPRACAAMTRPRSSKGRAAASGLPKVLSVEEVEHLLATAHAAVAQIAPEKSAERLHALRGRSACSNCFMRRACASRSSWRCQGSGAAQRASDPHSRQGRSRTARATLRAGTARHRALSRPPRDAAAAPMALGSSRQAAPAAM